VVLPERKRRGLSLKKEKGEREEEGGRIISAREKYLTF
jgi:hypothetical protein